MDIYKKEKKKKVLIQVGFAGQRIEYSSHI